MDITDENERQTRAWNHRPEERKQGNRKDKFQGEF
jgi:hypothetical protein